MPTLWQLPAADLRDPQPTRTMNALPDKQEILQCCISNLAAISTGVNADEISPRDSLTEKLVLDSLLLSSFVARLQDEFPKVDLTPWFIGKAQAGDDSLTNLAGFIFDTILAQNDS